MKLSDKQNEFAVDVTKLLVWLFAHNYKVTFGRATDTKAGQKLLFDAGLSKTMNSKHLKRLAIDLNIFIDGRLTYSAKKLKPVGDYWESLHPDNVWGGTWGWDAGHFQRS